MPEENIQKENLAEEKEEKQEKPSKKSILQFPFLVKWIGITAAILAASYFTVEKVLTPLFTSSGSSKTEVKSFSSSWKEKMGPIYRFEPIIVNLNEEGARRYLKVSLNLELNSSEVIKEIELLKPRLLDSLITLLSNKTLKDIEGAKDKENLRREIVGELNRHLNTGMVINAYFIEFMIQ